MNVLVLGGAGLLGQPLRRELSARGHFVVAPTHQELDITRPDQVARLAAGEFGEFDWIINCAAYTAVDRAESDAETAYAVNAVAPSYLALNCRFMGARLLHLSTDYVFGGAEGSGPWKENDPVAPQGVYARAKREGEEAILDSGASAVIVRVAWLFGPDGPCFPRAILVRARESGAVRVVNDQVGTPTYTPALASALVDLIETEPESGVFHLPGPESVTWFAFAERLIRAANVTAAVTPVTTAEYPTPAIRPKDSRLDGSKLAEMGIQLSGTLDDHIRDYLAHNRG